MKEINTFLIALCFGILFVLLLENGPNVISSLVMFFCIVIVIFIIFYLAKNTIKILSKRRKYLLAIKDVPSEILERYVEEYNNNSERLEALKLQLKIKHLIKYLLLLLLLVVPVMSLFMENITFFTIIVIAAIALIIFSINRTNREYTKEYKENVISNLIKYIGDELEYNYINEKQRLSDNEDIVNIAMHKYDNANFDVMTYNKFKIDDYIRGKVDYKIPFTITDIHLRKVTKGRYGERRTVFQGLFAWSTCEKSIFSNIRINKHSIIKEGKVLKMNNEKFDKYFDVYADDVHFAKEMLTTEIIEKITSFYNKYGIKVEIALRNNNVYLRFFTEEMFEPEVFGNNRQGYSIIIYYLILNFTKEIIRCFNNRISQLNNT